MWVVEVVEHVGYSFQKHAAGTCYIAENPTGFFAGCYLGAIPVFPGCDEVDKCIPICRSFDPTDLEKDLSQLTTVGRFRRVSAPAQPLSLDMDQAALDGRIRPEGFTLIPC